MSIVNKLASLNAEANVFSPVSKVKLESYKLEIEKYFQHENKALVSKLVQRLETNGRQITEYCRFCRNNGEKEEVYMSHVTKEASGNVQCPILRKYTCPVSHPEEVQMSSVPS